MKELNVDDVQIVSGGASTKTVALSATRIIAKNIARGFLIGSGVGTVLAVAWFAYDVYDATSN